MATPSPNAAVRAVTYAADLVGLADSTAGLRDAVERMDDAGCRASSALPGWTRGHVLTHLARNADGMRNLCAWATTGVETPMYPSRASRDADIEAGADRPLVDLRTDLIASATALAEALAALPAEALEAELRLGSGAAVSAWELPRLRRREVEIHRADLAVGYGPDDWPEDFCLTALDGLADGAGSGRELPVEWLADGTGRVWHVGRPGTLRDGAQGMTLVGPPGQLLAWLVGRGSGPDLRSDPPGSVPPSPAWV